MYFTESLTYGWTVLDVIWVELAGMDAVPPILVRTSTLERFLDNGLLGLDDLVMVLD